MIIEISLSFLNFNQETEENIKNSTVVFIFTCIFGLLSLIIFLLIVYNLYNKFIETYDYQRIKNFLFFGGIARCILSNTKIYFYR